MYSHAIEVHDNKNSAAYTAVLQLVVASDIKSFVTSY
jgi:hypothetical protein